MLRAMYRFEGRQLIIFGAVIILCGVVFVIVAVAGGPGWMVAGGAGVAVVGAVQAFIGRDHLRLSRQEDAEE